MTARVGATAADVANFLSRSSDDAGCVWLCTTAGNRSRAEEEGLAQVTRTLAGGILRGTKALPTQEQMLRRVS